MREELAHRCEPGPVEMGTALPEFGPSLCLDLVGIGIGADQDLAVEGGVGPECEARHGREGSIEQKGNKWLGLIMLRHWHQE